MKYRDNMTGADLAAFMAEIHAQDQMFADAADHDDAAAASIPACGDEEYECFDPVRDGWVGKDGRP